MNQELIKKLENENKRLQDRKSLLEETARADKLERLLITVLVHELKTLENVGRLSAKKTPDDVIKSRFANYLADVQFDFFDREMVENRQVRAFIEKMLK